MYRIIIADDEPDIRCGLETILDWNASGFQVTATTENGLQTLQLCESQGADLVITDIRMPLMDGLELARRLKQLSTRIQVIILSGYRDFAYAKRAIGCGVNNYLLKPVDTEELAEELRRIKLTLDRLHLPEEKTIVIAEDISPDSTVSSVIAYINAHFAENLSLQDLGEQFFLNPAYLGKLIKKDRGISFHEYLNYVRIQQAKLLLKSTSLSIHEIVERVGYHFEDHFYRNFKKFVSLNPGDYRQLYK